VGVSPAAAQPLERGHFHDVSSEVDDEFCGDLTVRIDTDLQGTFLLNAHGPDGLVYRIENFHGTVSYTNLANDLTLTEVFNLLSRDVTFTDNGDGTATVLVLVTGGHEIYGPDGERLFVDTGPGWFELLIDSSNGEVLEFLGLVKRVGRDDLEGTDFCDIIHEFIG
jgi:hypothetical protein